MVVPRGGNDVDVEGAGAGNVEEEEALEAIFWIRSRSLADRYSKTERGADGRGVSPRALPHWKRGEIEGQHSIL